MFTLDDRGSSQSKHKGELRVESKGELWLRRESDNQKAEGKKEEAHQLLAEFYGWFTEGFDTADLKEAKALLEKLS